MSEISSTFRPGPLDHYRQLASFNWQRLKLFLYGQEYIDYEKQVSDEFIMHPEFYANNLETPKLDEIRRNAVRKIITMHNTNVVNKLNNNVQKQAIYKIDFSIDAGTSILGGLNFGLFTKTILYMGTERHEHFVDKIDRGEFTGGFALTEIGHGSNTKGMRTTATYDIQSKQFILNSPDFEAAKCWAGVLGHTATHAVVFAHLTTPDGIKRGLHAFVVPLRNPYTLIPYPGVTIFDMGEKIGYNAIDNGVVMFKNYCIPRENLLNRHSDVLEDGTYQTPYKDTNKLHGASFGNLSSGRLEISMSNGFFLTNALTIAIRYAAVRKQFGIGNGDEEIPLLEYQTHQYRLLPYLSATYCFAMVCNFLYDYRSPSNDGSGSFSELAAEIHGVSSALKPVTAWVARDGIQECREACGGHGYLKAARLGDLRNDQDACCTYEGANHVLLQQTSTWLLKLWPSILSGKKINTPLKSLDFLNDLSRVVNSKFSARNIEEIMEANTILRAYQWLVCYYLKRYHEKYQILLESTKNPIVAKNNSQIYIANDLSTAYIEHFILVKSWEKIQESSDYQIKTVLTKLMSLYGLWSLQKHLTTLYAGGYTTGPMAGTLIQDAVLQLCADLKNEAVALIDTMAPPDFCLNSVLGHSDGQVYKRLEAAMMQAPGAMSRPTWWKEIVYWKDYVKSKL